MHVKNLVVAHIRKYIVKTWQLFRILHFVSQILRFMSGRLLYGITKLYGVYGVNNHNTPFNVTDTKGRRIREM